MKERKFGLLQLLCFVIPITITYPLLEYQKIQVKNGIKLKLIAGIDKNELVLLKFTNKECISTPQLEHSRELEYRTQMYDIVETETRGDTTYYWCWSDNEETKVNKRLEDLVSLALGLDSKRKESQKRVESFYKSLFFEHLPVKHPFLPQLEQAETPYKFNSLALSFPPPNPPPEIS